MMLSKKFYFYLKVISLLSSIGLFSFLQLVRLGDTATYHVLFEQDFTWQAYYHFLVNQENMVLLLLCVVGCYLPLCATWVVDKWLLPKFKNRKNL